jgi:hypothetical protein
MNELSDDVKDKILNRYISQREYMKQYYKQYQKDNKDIVNKHSKNYINKLKEDPEKYEEFKLKRKQYYDTRGKDLAKARYEKMKKLKAQAD